MKTGWKKTIAPLVLVLGAVALAACGGSDSKSTDSATATGAVGAPSETLLHASFGASVQKTSSIRPASRSC